jgi:molecular chaperone Hsp33
MSSRSATSGSHWIKCIATHGNIRGVAIQATELVQRAATMHQVTGMGAQGLGEAMIGALFIGSYCKPGERVNLNIQGSGRYVQALVDAHPDGTVRGYVIEREQHADEVITREDGETPMGPWGNGVMSVLRTKGTEGKQPYIGTVPLVTGHFAKDLSFYWMQSEQVPSACGVKIITEGATVKAAGGFLVQAMPGASQDELKAIESHINDLHSLEEQISADFDPVQLLSKIFQSTPFMIVEDRPLEFVCQCSWDRVKRALVLVGAQELRAMLDEDGEAIVRCDFCTKEYRVNRTQLQEMIDGENAAVREAGEAFDGDEEGPGNA